MSQSTNYIIILSANSDLAKAAARQLLKAGYGLILCGINAHALEGLQADLQPFSHWPVLTESWDLNLREHSHELLFQLIKEYPVQGVLIATGVMPPQEEAEANPKLTLETISLNYSLLVVLLNFLAPLMAQHARRPAPFISCITSVAGERGRRRNFIYGSAKAGMSAFLQGLRSKYAATDLLIQTIKPGYIQTKMTQGLPPRLWISSADVVGLDIAKGIQKRKDIVYTPWFWRWICILTRNLPEFLFKRTNF